jgi:hypothetical protein
LSSGQFYDFWLPALAILSALLVYSWLRDRKAANREARSTPLDFVAIVIVVLTVLILGLAIIPSAKWGFTDDDIFILHYLQGRPFPPPIWESVGRFFPMAHQEWRLIYLWTHDIKVFHAFSLVQYTCFSFGILLLLRELKAANRLALLFTLTLPPVLVVYANLVVPERTQLMFMPWLLFSLVKWDRTEFVGYALMAVICVHFMLYLKEPTVLFVLTLALVRLLLTAHRAFVVLRAKEHERGSLRRLIRSSLPDLGLVLSVVVFLVLYFSAIAIDTPFSDRAYDGRFLSGGRIQPTLFMWAQTEPLLVVLFAIAAARTGSRIMRGISLDIFDYLPVAAAVYLLALVLSGLISTYYAALPMAATAIAVVCPVILRLRGGSRSLPTATVSVLLCLGIVLNVSLAVPRLLYKQDWTARNDELTNRLSQMIAADQESRHVFLKGHSWDAEMLSVYANAYRNEHIVFVIDDKIYGNNREDDIANNCQYASRYCLLYSSEPLPNQLIVDLGRLESKRLATISKYGQVLWRYEDEKLNDLMAVTPEVVHATLRHFYNFW